MFDKLSYLLEEDKDHRYIVYKEEKGKRTKIDQCDRIAAESLVLQAREFGIPVRWSYMEDQFLTPQPLW